MLIQHRQRRGGGWVHRDVEGRRKGRSKRLKSSNNERLLALGNSGEDRGMRGWVIKMLTPCQGTAGTWWLKPLGGAKNAAEEEGVCEATGQRMRGGEQGQKWQNEGWKRAGGIKEIKRGCCGVCRWRAQLHPQGVPQIGIRKSPKYLEKVFSALSVMLMPIFSTEFEY